jgi:predicted RNase H-like nuclease (RuvC/YqgF family)
MDTKIKIYIAVASAAFLLITGYSVWSNLQIGRLERAAEDAMVIAAQKEKLAGELEAKARVYEEKIAYLESNLAELKTLARKQDEELKNIEITTGRARADVERVRSIRSAAATADEVCRKLADLGHPCQ